MPAFGRAIVSASMPAAARDRNARPARANDPGNVARSIGKRFDAVDQARPDRATDQRP